MLQNPRVSFAAKEKANEEDNDSAKQEKGEEAKPAADSEENKKEVTDEHKEDDSIKGELGEVIRELGHASELLTKSVFFFNFGQWFCPNFWTNSLYDSKDTQKYKFRSVKLL